MNAEQKSFIEVVGAIASADMKNSGVAASLTTAQAILESAWGKSELTKTGNALFGIKATKDWKGKTLTRKTTEYEDGKKVQVEAEFRAYDTWEDSVKDHSAFLKKYKRYAKVIGETDYKEACKAVAAAGYATDPEYAKKLIELIETYELYNYDTKDTKTDDLGAEDKKYYRVQAGAYRRTDYERSRFNMVEFGEQLRRAREEKGMTQQSLAEQLYVTRQAVSRWECGDR